MQELLAMEVHLAYPQLMKEPDVLRFMLAVDAQTGDGSDFAEALQAALNTGQALLGSEPADPPGASPLSAWLGDSYSLVKDRTAHDPFADGRLGRLLVIQHRSLSVAAFIVQGEAPGSYQVTRVNGWVSNMWTSTHQDTYELIDVDRDGSAEIGYYRQAEWQNAQGSQNTYSIYKWDPGKHQFVDILQASVTPGPGGVFKNWFTALMQDIAERQIYGTTDYGCYQTRTLYAWKQAGYAKIGEELQPLEGQAAPRCKAEWAEALNTAGDQAIQAMESALAGWQASDSEAAGPAAEDYHRLELGIWQATGGQSAAALENLQAVRDHPKNPGYAAASQMAAAFLQHYPSESLYAACKAVSNYISTDLGTTAPYLQREDLGQYWRQQWGFTRAAWSDELPLDGLCSLEESFKVSLPAAPLPQAQGEMEALLSKLGISWVYLQRADLDFDGQMDWLLVEPPSGQGSYSSSGNAWALLQKGAERMVANGAISLDAGEAVLKRAMITGQAGLNFILQGQRRFVFSISPSSSGGLKLSVMQITGAGCIQILQDKGRLERCTDQGIRSYTWDAKEKTLVETQAWVDGQAGRQIREQVPQAQKALLAMDLQTAIRLLAPLYQAVPKANTAITGWQEQIAYLLGLSYELSGQPEQAVQAYWQLWRDFPESPLVEIVKLKLTAGP